MSLTFSQTQGNGVTLSYPIVVQGGYFNDEDIVVEFIDIATGVVTEVPSTEYEIDSGTVIFDVAPSSAVYVRIRRGVTYNSTYSDFTKGNAFGEDNLNNSFSKALYQTQTLADGFKPDGYYEKSNVNFGNNRITNLQDGVDEQDAVTVSQLSAVSSSQEILSQAAQSATDAANSASSAASEAADAAASAASAQAAADEAASIVAGDHISISNETGGDLNYALEIKCALAAERYTYGIDMLNMNAITAGIRMETTEPGSTILFDSGDFTSFDSALNKFKWTIGTNLILALTTDGLDAQAKTISNVADPVDPQDVVTKQYFEDNGGTGSGDFVKSTAGITTDSGDGVFGISTDDAVGAWTGWDNNCGTKVFRTYDDTLLSGKRRDASWHFEMRDANIEDFGEVDPDDVMKSTAINIVAAGADATGTLVESSKDIHGLVSLAVAKTTGWDDRGVSGVIANSTQYGSGVATNELLAVDSGTIQSSGMQAVMGIITPNVADFDQGGGNRVYSAITAQNSGTYKAKQGVRVVSSPGDFEYALDMREADAVSAGIRMPNNAVAGSIISYDIGDYTSFNQTNNTYVWTIGGLNVLFIEPAGLNCNNKKIRNVAEPTLSTDVATKNYVDTQASGLAAGPEFSATHATRGGLTGAGGFYSLYGDLEWTEEYDLNGTFYDGKFTAPADGIYEFSGLFSLTGLNTSATLMTALLIHEPAAGGSTNHTLLSLKIGNIVNSGNLAMPFTKPIQMLENDEVYLWIQVTGMSTDVAGIYQTMTFHGKRLS